LNLSQLYYFKKLAELEHYTQAAKELYISQPALSDAIHSLENELGVPLFQRVGRNVKLTKYGREFNEYVKAGLQEIDNGVARARSYSTSPRGNLNIGAIFTVQGDYLPALLNAFNDKVSNEVSFTLFQGFSLPLIEGLRRGEYDAVFAAKPEHAEDLECVPVVAHELVAVVQKDHPLAFKHTVRLEELQPYHVYTYRPGTPIGNEVNAILDSHAVRADQAFEDEITIGGAIAADGKSVGLCTYTIGLAAYQNVKPLILEGVPKEFHRIYLITLKDDFQPFVLEEFKRFTAAFEPPEGTVPHLVAPL
jgi:LysR family transcriptional activator of glutamate synthase operon